MGAEVGLSVMTLGVDDGLELPVGVSLGMSDDAEIGGDRTTGSKGAALGAELGLESTEPGVLPSPEPLQRPRFVMAPELGRNTHTFNTFEASISTVWTEFFPSPVTSSLIGTGLYPIFMTMRIVSSLGTPIRPRNWTSRNDLVAVKHMTPPLALSSGVSWSDS